MHAMHRLQDGRKNEAARKEGSMRERGVPPR
jgi:hypothetical protein